MNKGTEASSLNFVYGFGINDFAGKVSKLINGRRFNIKSYQTWRDMLKRCYDKKEHKKRRHYEGCLVCEEWRSFNNFNQWWLKNHVDGWHLDKDLLYPGNKIYSPATCVFIPAELNTLTTSNGSRRGPYLVGVSKGRFKSRYDSHINVHGERTHLGHFSTEMEAHEAWYRKKIDIAYEYKELCDSIHPDLFDGLIGKIDSMKGARI